MESAHDGVNPRLMRQLLDLTERVNDSRMCATQYNNQPSASLEEKGLVIEQGGGILQLLIQEKRAASILKRSRPRNLPGHPNTGDHFARFTGTDARPSGGLKSLAFHEGGVCGFCTRAYGQTA